MTTVRTFGGLLFFAAFAAITCLATPFTATAQTSDAPVLSVAVLQLQQARGRQIWECVNRIRSDIAQGDISEGVEALVVAWQNQIMASDWQVESIELQLLNALLAHHWPGANPPDVIIEMYDRIDRVHDPALRAEILRAISQVSLLDVKPLIIEGSRLSHALAAVPEHKLDGALEEEARAYVEVCKGRMTSGLAAVLGEIAAFSHVGRTVRAAGKIARLFYDSRKGKQP